MDTDIGWIGTIGMMFKERKMVQSCVGAWRFRERVCCSCHCGCGCLLAVGLCWVFSREGSLGFTRKLVAVEGLLK